MITEISLDSVASYKSKVRLNTEKKVNLVYGLNGSGKSTFSNYFYDLENPKYAKCSIVHNGEKVLVYNQKFINDNFYQTESLKGIFGLSKENKVIEEKIIKETKELEVINKEKADKVAIIEQENKKITDARIIAEKNIWDIKKTYSGGDRVFEYCLDNLKGNKSRLYSYLSSLPMPAKPTNTIEHLKEELNAIDGDTAVKQNTLNVISLNNLTLDSINVLNEIVIGNDDSPVAALIDKLQNSDWVISGLQYLKDIDGDECPFCQSKTMTAQLVEQIKDYFDESYQDKVGTIKLIEIEYNTLTQDFPTLDSYKPSKYASEYLLKLIELHSEIYKIIEGNKKLITMKISRPSMQIGLKDISKQVGDFNDLVININASINLCNSKIDNVVSEKKRIKEEFWNILRYQYDHAISGFEKINNAAKKSIHTAEIERENKDKEATIKEKVIVEQQKFTVNIEEAVENIKYNLKDIGITDFSIEKYEDNLYRIVRSDVSDNVFTSLSEGEKMIISFLYFRELFRGKQTATEITQKKIAIIDDPVSSLSHIFVYNIGRLIKNDFFNSDNVEQVFVLTHSLYFFYELTDTNRDRRNSTQKLFRLSKNEMGSSIYSMKYEEIQNDYHSYWSVINDDKQPPALIANCMRNIVEYFFNFVQKKDLSNVTQIPVLQANKFQEFIRYINRESHSVGQNIIDFKEFDYITFKEAFRLLFEAAGYSEHYKKMSKIN
ncbi:AAA family ATPase [Photobacterium phosphoreum]|uniref:AAA family ATPase n=1 Tax=Photobacterium phosphoreum TaxID=659 RepID=UPI001E494A1D|nr:AAA family ATPase [Photobacterium phosphoreum]MCD9477380.1 AAA family ATPase [Photobacterium phosphoreum]MCF2178205.1 AAA family ATPase [Photobacterium phosphoreum]